MSLVEFILITPILVLIMVLLLLLVIFIAKLSKQLTTPKSDVVQESTETTTNIDPYGHYILCINSQLFGDVVYSMIGYEDGTVKLIDNTTGRCSFFTDTNYQNFKDLLDDTINSYFDTRVVGGIKK